MRHFFEVKDEDKDRATKALADLNIPFTYKVETELTEDIKCLVLKGKSILKDAGLLKTPKKPIAPAKPRTKVLSSTNSKKHSNKKGSK